MFDFRDEQFATNIIVNGYEKQQTMMRDAAAGEAMKETKNTKEGPPGEKKKKVCVRQAVTPCSQKTEEKSDWRKERKKKT